MKNFYYYFIFIVLFVGCHHSKNVTPIGVKKELHYCVQKIVGVIPEYVIIDTDVGIREDPKSVKVYRMIDQNNVYVGKIDLVEFQDRLAVARIIKEEEGSNIEVGDFVYLQYKSYDKLNVKEYIDFVENELAVQKKFKNN